MHFGLWITNIPDHPSPAWQYEEHARAPLPTMDSQAECSAGVNGACRPSAPAEIEQRQARSRVQIPSNSKLIGKRSLANSQRWVASCFF
jgi:hypothetical protein